MYDICRYIIQPSLFAKIGAMVEANYSLTLSYKSANNPQLQYTNEHAKALMQISIMMNLCIPIITHFAYMRKVSDSLRLALAEEKMLEDIERYKKQVTGKEILSMSFYKGTLNTAMAIAIIQKTSRKCRYTYGLKYRNPTTRDVFISKEKAIEHIRKGSFIDVAFKDDVIDINEYSDNDMW